MSAPGITTVEQRYLIAEQAAELKRSAKQRRQPLILLALVNVLILGVAVTAVIDLRRLHTAGGAALVWTQAALFGECDDYLNYSVPDPSVSDPRSPARLCHDLRAATGSARAQSGKIGLRLEHVDSSGRRSTVRLLLTRDEKPATVSLRLEKIDGRWRVVRDALTCGSIGCP